LDRPLVAMPLRRLETGGEEEERPKGRRNETNAKTNSFELEEGKEEKREEAAYALLTSNAKFAKRDNRGKKKKGRGEFREEGREKKNTLTLSSSIPCPNGGSAREERTVVKITRAAFEVWVGWEKKEPEGEKGGKKGKNVATRLLPEGNEEREEKRVGGAPGGEGDRATVPLTSTRDPFRGQREQGKEKKGRGGGA